MSADDFDDSHWRSAGERIQALLAACAVDTPAAQARAEQLVREVVDLYGAALTRVMAVVDDPVLADRLAADDLIGSLLLVHGLHPHDVTERVSRALDAVRPYLGSHGGDVRLLDVSNGVVRLSFVELQQLPFLAVTLELAVAGRGAHRGPGDHRRRGGCRRGRVGDPRRLADVAGARGPGTNPRRGMRPRSWTRWHPARLPGSPSAMRRCWRAGSGMPCWPTSTTARSAPLVGRGVVVGRGVALCSLHGPLRRGARRHRHGRNPRPPPAGAGPRPRRSAVHGGARHTDGGLRHSRPHTRRAPGTAPAPSPRTAR